MTAETMTPREAADVIGRWVDLRKGDDPRDRAMRALVDHARAVPTRAELEDVEGVGMLHAAIGDLGAILDHLALEQGVTKTELRMIARRARQARERIAVAIRDQDAPTAAVLKLRALAWSWNDRAGEQRRTLRSSTVSVEEAQTCGPVADAWEEAARELRGALQDAVVDPEAEVAAALVEKIGESSVHPATLLEVAAEAIRSVRADGSE